MATYSIRKLVFVCVISVAAAGTGPPTSSAISKNFRTNTGSYGVASIAGVTSRNGRVSSVSSVKYFPGNSNYYPKSGDLPEPITFSKEENGRITSGSIKYGPGSVSVSSSARSYPSGSKFNKLDDNVVFPPIPTFNSRSFDPWFNFKPPSPPKLNSKSGWPFSNPFSDPFNFWQ